MIRSILLAVLMFPTVAFASVDSLLTLAADTLRSQDERVSLLKVAVKQDRSARAMHALGRLLMESGGVSSVYNAERWLKRAVQREPNNGDIYASLAELYWRIGRRSTAIEYAERGIDRDPNNPLPLFWAGRFEMWDMTRYLNAQREGYLYNDDGSIDRSAIDLEQFGIRARDKAVGYLTRAVSVAPDYWPAFHLLGLVYYEGQKKGEVAGLFEGYVKRHPESAPAHFFLGLGYQANGDLPRAYAAYTEGLKRLSRADQRFMMGVFLMADPDSTAPNMEAIRRFWTGRDPLFLTQYNERLLEHCRRVAYADLRFGDPFKGVPGWLTDRGQMYIRYGEPMAVDSHPAEVYTGIDQPNTTQDSLALMIKRNMIISHKYSNRIELWRYDGFTLAFENLDTRDAWRFAFGWNEEDFNAMGLSDFIERWPDYFVDPYKMRRYAAPFQVAQFRGDRDSTRVEVYYALPTDEVTATGESAGLRDVKLNQGLFLFDAKWDTLRRDVERVTKLPFLQYNGMKTGYVLAGDWLSLTPGKYFMAVETEDVASLSLGTFRDTLHVRRFAPDSLDVSDLLLAQRVVEREDRPFGRSRFMVLSNPLKQCENNGQTVVYFEIYNLSRDKFGGTHYQLTFQVRALSAANVQDKTDWATAVSYEQRGNRDWEPLHLALDLGKLMPGPKALRVVVKDLQSREEAISMTRFRVMW